MEKTPDAFEIIASLRGSRLVITVTGRLDSLNAPLLEHQLTEAVEAGRHDLVIDLAAVNYVSSKGLSALLQVGKRIKRHDGRMVLAGLTEPVRQIIMISGFDRIFEIFPSVEAALGAA